MRKLRLGVIGAGSWAVASHLPNFARRRDEVEVSVALSAPPASADDLGEEIGGRYTDLADRIGVPLC